MNFARFEKLWEDAYSELESLHPDEHAPSTNTWYAETREELADCRCYTEQDKTDWLERHPAPDNVLGEGDTVCWVTECNAETVTEIRSTATDGQVLKLLYVDFGLVSDDWQPTHMIEHDMYAGGNSYCFLVSLNPEGPAYTRGEWEVEENADYVVVNGEWLFQGQPFACTVERLAKD